MPRLIVFAIFGLLIFLPGVPEAGSLSQIDELERRFDDYDHRLTGVEKKIYC